MAIASDVRLAPHFTAGELGADNPAIEPIAEGNLRFTTAPRLEHMRGILGVPMDVTSGYRTWERNAAIGGSPTSDHPTGLAADFSPRGLSLFDAWRKLKAAADTGQLQPFDQIIYYPADGHIHVGYGPANRREVLIKIGETYSVLTDALASKLTGFVADATRVVDSISKETGTAPSTVLLVLALLIGFIVWRSLT